MFFSSFNLNLSRWSRPSLVFFLSDPVLPQTQESPTAQFGVVHLSTSLASMSASTIFDCVYAYVYWPYPQCVSGIRLSYWIYKLDVISFAIPVSSNFTAGFTFSLRNFQVWIYFCHISPSKPAAQSLGSVCHTTLHKHLDLYSSWCSKCAVIAQSHMLSGVFRVSHQIYSSAVHVIMMPALAAAPPPPPPPPIFSPFCMLIRVIVIKPAHLPAWKCLAALLVDWRKCFCVPIWLGHRQRAPR